MGFLANKRILVTGMISNRSIAYGVAQAMRREGAELAFTYQGERVKDRVIEMAREFGSDMIYPCDVSSDTEIEQLFTDLGKKWEKFDGFATYSSWSSTAPTACFSGSRCSTSNVSGGFSRTACLLLF